MKTAITTANPFAAAKHQPSALAAAEENRAASEIQAALVIAKRFPRDHVAAMDRILNACTRPTLAAQSLYSYAKGDTDISGPSIRLAESLAQNWGNLQFGFREINRSTRDGVGFSEVEAYAWDLETNVRKPLNFQVKHWRDTRQGGYALKDEREIYELIANQASRRVRNAILAIIPGDVTEAAQKQCEATMAADADCSKDAQKKIIEAFRGYNVTKDQIEKLIQRRLDSIQPAQVIRLRKILTSLKDGMSSADDWFEAASTAPSFALPQPEPKVKAKAQPEPQPEPQPEIVETQTEDDEIP